MVSAISLLPCVLSAQTAVEASLGIASNREKAAHSHSSLVIVVSSAILPGAGQLLMHQKRSIVYLALEATGAAFYLSERRQGDRERDRYRQLSRTIARAQFSPDGPRGSWDYYEQMEKYVASGAYDLLPGGDLEPETDLETFNGAAWLLARQTYWRDPEVPPPAGTAEYRAALDFYISRAVKPEFQWSWIGAPEAFQRYRLAISQSNSSFRNAEQILSLVLANHFLSAVDAYASIKLRIRRSNGETALVASLPL
jgi:hypothetical protein